MNIRRQYTVILVLTSLLTACSTVGQRSAHNQNVEGAAASNVASRVLGDDISGDCNVPPDSGRTQYIIGYGSLMQDASRKRTSPQAGPAHPVEIKGYRRGWYARAEAVGFSATYLGVVPDRESYLNAVIYEVDPAELIATDKREVSYCRTSAAISDIKPLEREFSPKPNGQAWIYVSRPQSVATPSSRYPIVQSYVDIFVSGCLEQEQRFGLTDFSQQCLSTTADWSEHWVNDRIYPRRPFVFQPKARQIDNLLSKQLPHYFSHIRIESGG
jgi:hypothetical protein